MTVGNGVVSETSRAAVRLTAPAGPRRDRVAEIDWSDPIDDSAPHLPESHLPLFGTAAWRAMSERERNAYSRHECASFLSTAVWFENILMALAIRHLAGVKPDDPSHRFLLEEVADECRHSSMFGEYVRRADTPAYWPTLRHRMPGAVVRACPDPVVSFIAMLGGEELVDSVNRATLRAEGVHPVSRHIARVHVAEEGRHVSYARTFLAETWPHLGPLRRAAVAAAAPIAAFAIADCLVHPGVYWTLGIPDGFRLALTNPAHHRRIATDYSRFTSFLEDLGVINASTRPLWWSLGLLVGRPASLEDRQ